MEQETARRRRAPIASVVALALVASGCAHHRLVVPESNPYGEYQRVTSHAFLWGAIEPKTPAVLCETNLLNEVRTITSVPQAAATVLTLGIWMPATVEYKCAKRPSEPGSTDD